MAVYGEVELARADVNDSYGVSVWQRKRLLDYATTEARELAAEILHAADEADRLEAADRKAAFGGHECQPVRFPLIDPEEFEADTYWNGQPVRCTRGTAVVADSRRFPDYWARREGIIGERIPVVRVGVYEYIDDRGGIGWAKVTVADPHAAVGMGHRNVDIEPGSFVAAEAKK